MKSLLTFHALIVLDKSQQAVLSKCKKLKTCEKKSSPQKTKMFLKRKRLNEAHQNFVWFMKEKLFDNVCAGYLVPILA